jgi:hypothetical protein
MYTSRARHRKNLESLASNYITPFISGGGGICARQAALKIDSFECREGVARGDEVGAVDVAGWREMADHGEHFGGVAAGAEDDEDVRWGGAGGRGGTARGEDGEDAELGGVSWSGSLGGRATYEDGGGEEEEGGEGEAEGCGFEGHGEVL